MPLGIKRLLHCNNSLSFSLISDRGWNVAIPWLTALGCFSDAAFASGSHIWSVCGATGTPAISFAVLHIFDCKASNQTTTWSAYEITKINQSANQSINRPTNQGLTVRGMPGRYVLCLRSTRWERDTKKRRCPVWSWMGQRRGGDRPRTAVTSLS